MSKNESGSSVARARRDPRVASKSGNVPQAGRQQNIEGVRKLVTRHYSYLVYYSVDEETEEIVVLTIQHPAREREYSDT